MEERTRTRRNVRRRRKDVHKRTVEKSMATREAAMEKNEEICPCHGQEWPSEVEMLEHQVRHHRQLTEQGKKELEIFQTAVGEVVETNSQQKMKEEKAMLEEKRAAFEEERKQIEKLPRIQANGRPGRMGGASGTPGG